MTVAFNLALTNTVDVANPTDVTSLFAAAAPVLPTGGATAGDESRETLYESDYNKPF